MILHTLRYELKEGIATITFDEQGSPVNTMCLQWQQDLATATAQLLQDRTQVRGLILASAKSTFFAGADLKAVMRSNTDDGVIFFKQIEAVKRCFRQIETLGVPVVTCINGAALGGGLEVALVGHHRVAINNPKIQLGFPEVNLGLIPGAGGITKLTRLLGLVAAQPYVLACQLFNPQEALALGLVHALVDTEAQLRDHALAYIESAQGQPELAQHVWDRKDYKMPGGSPSSPKLSGLLSVAPAMLKQKTRGLYPAPEAALAAMVEGALVDFDTAMRIESRYLAGVMRSQVTRNMINTFFFNMNSLRAAQKERLASQRARSPLETALCDLVAKAQGRQSSAHAVWAAEPAFLSRLYTAYVDEGLALRQQGIPDAAIDNLAQQAGFALGPLALQQAVGSPGALDNRSEVEVSVFDAHHIKDRMLYRLALEAARCLHDACVSTVADANVGSMFGVGFPAWAGGALQFIHGQGLPVFQERCAALAATHGEGFALTSVVMDTLHKHQPVY